MTSRGSGVKARPCAHHWLLESVPDGGLTGAACRDCGATRTLTGGVPVSYIGATNYDAVSRLGVED